MSIPVAVDELAEALAPFADAFLMTTDPSTVPARVKVVSVRPVLDDGVLVVTAPGRGSLANAGANPVVTVLWPPVEEGGMSLIVDGDAEVRDGGLRVCPTGGVLHRPAGEGHGA
ncbi:MAG: pyridoxamine 5'-phosphate oxidase [Nocardioides marinisabuli]|uniref:pyridoxamine 5'-phosphate oxidase n=1 Tax=Nocardioides marinisabuli TaxID=419476 RepID=UPI00321A7080